MPPVPDVSPAQLRTLRRSAGLTQREVAGLADCSLASVANMEHGYIPRNGAVLHRVLDVLNDERRPAEAAIGSAVDALIALIDSSEHPADDAALVVGQLIRWREAEYPETDRGD